MPSFRESGTSVLVYILEGLFRTIQTSVSFWCGTTVTEWEEEDEARKIRKHFVPSAQPLVPTSIAVMSSVT